MASRGQPMAPWRVLLRSYPCPTCGAGPGEPCQTSTGHQADIEHAGRAAQAARCPKCGTRVDGDSHPGDLCPRCQLLRNLDTERATTWKRLHP